MLIEGNLLLGLLIGVSIAIVLVVVIVRYVIKNGSAAPTGSILSRLARGNGQAAASDGPTASETADPAGGGQLPDDGLALPSLDDLGGLSADQAEKPAGAGQKKNPASAGLGTVAKDLLGSLLGRRKKPEQVKSDVKEIDDQLNQVLQESQNLGLDIPSAIKVPDIGIMADSKNLRDIEKEMRSQSTIPERKQESSPQPQSIEGLNPYLQGGSLDISSLEPAVPKPEPNKPQEQPKPDLSRQPQTPKPPEASSSSGNASKGSGGPMDMAGDLLSEIAAESVKEEKVNMSIMKDLKDVPIACDELEKDLSGILDQISLNTKAGGKKKNAS